MNYKIKDIGERIKKERKKKYSSHQKCVDALADKYHIHISRQTLSNIESGLVKSDSFSLHLLTCFCGLFDCDMNYLLGMQDKPKMTIVETANIIGLHHDTVMEIYNLNQKQKSVLDNLASVNIPTSKEPALQAMINSILDYVMCPPVANMPPIKAEFSNYEYQIKRNESLAFIKTVTGKRIDTILDAMYTEYEQERNAIIGDNLIKPMLSAMEKVKNMSENEILEEIQELNADTKATHK